MKLSEALILRADLKTRISQLKERMNDNAKVQEGEEASQDPNLLLQEFEEVAAQMLRLIQRINKTNAAAEFEIGRTLTDALAERDILVTRRKGYEGLIEAATIRHDRYTRSEVKFKSIMNVSQLQKKLDSIAKDYRELDTKIQSLNWQVDLVE